MAEQTGTYLLPPHPDCCQTCATKHAPELPHNAQSLYYQVAFNMEHSRAPNWLDAMAHCSPEIREVFRSILIDVGVDVDGGDILPKSAESAHG